MDLTTEQILSEIRGFLDEQGRIRLFPAKHRKKFLILCYLSTKFETGVDYTEKQVNEIIDQNHTFQDKWLLRRELIDRGFMQRLTDGSRYWKSEVQPKLES